MAEAVTFGSQLRRESRPDGQRKGSSDVSTNFHFAFLKLSRAALLHAINIHNRELN
jgi:hypothetical protein